MNIYFVKLNGNDYSTEQYYTTNSYEQLLKWVQEDLEDCGGGHADIYKEITCLIPIENVKM